MDKETRNRIQRATQDARALLQREYREQLDGTFDIRLDGTIGQAPGAHLGPEDRILRDKLVAAVQHQAAGGRNTGEAVADYLREAAFTTLNRFVALKMLEARGLVQECVSKGQESAGFKEFTGLAQGLVLLADHGYRLYIESIFDEIGREVGVLFDRRDPASLLWPRRQALADLLDILNDPEVAGVWAEDETIGWTYQYFNTDRDREKARYDDKGKPKAPQNSHELAVRNQFFTPRYVVQFLTDNTLGRIWYEMQGGKTRLVDECEYLVRRTDETYEPRTKKDPRDLRVLDPACGSGHFLLYSFDLLATIYEEAWADPGAPRSEVTGRSLREDYPNLGALRRELPGLVLRHNLHGVDIDARCAQIAQLALWMRAERAFDEYAITRAERPQIRRVNVVVAEPMPGEDDLLREFVDGLGDRVLADHFGRIVTAMKLAGEMGLLVRLEDLVKTNTKKGQTGNLFAPPEERIRGALSRFVRETTASEKARHRLFAEDAARGLGLVELTEQKFDVVLMNPPFGAATSGAVDLLHTAYPLGYVDLCTAFVDRGVALAAKGGVVGAITSRTALFLSKFKHWRRGTLLTTSSIQEVADFGQGVLDATVETAAYTVHVSASSDRTPEAIFLDCRDGDPRELLATSIKVGQDRWYRVALADVLRRPDAIFKYRPTALDESPSRDRIALAGLTPVNKGGGTGEDERFIRLAWEVAPAAGRSRRWRWLAKGGEHAPFYLPLHLTIDWLRDGDYLGQTLFLRRPREGLRWGAKSRTERFQGLPGVCWSRRSQKGVSFRILPRGVVVSDKSPFAGTEDPRLALGLLAYLNSGLVQREADALTSFGSYELGVIGSLSIDLVHLAELTDLGAQGLDAAKRIGSHVETDPGFRPLLRRVDFSNGVPDAIEAVRQDVGHQVRLLEEVLARIDSALGPKHHLPMVERLSFFRNLLSKISAANIASELVGVLFGRWSIEPAKSATSAAVDDLFKEPAPAALGVQSTSTIRTLVEDPGHERDICGCSREALATRFGGAVPDSLDSALQRLGVRDLREWLRHRFFDHHIAGYSGSARSAPIYWQLATPSGSYSVWLYFHAFGRDTLYATVNDYVAPKLAHEERRLAGLVQAAGGSPTAGQRKEIDAQDTFVAELRAFRDELARVAPLWNPDLDDGVIINFAPLWRLVPQHRAWQKECKDCWDKVVDGEYDWAHLAMHLWPERVVPKCADDRSLAIAHGLEDVFWVEGSDGKWTRRKVAQATIDKLVAERTSPAVKDALASLLSAPAATGSKAPKKRTSRPPAQGRAARGRKAKQPDAKEST